MTTKIVIITIICTLFFMFVFASVLIYVDTEKELRRMEESMKAEKQQRKQKDISELRDEILALTGVDIQIDDDTFKSTYDILKEISYVWDDLTDVSQANVLRERN